MKPNEIAAFFKERFIHYMPNAVFVLLPVFTLILYLLYRKSGRFFAEHSIFTLHIHAFAFVALIILLPLPDSISWLVPVWILMCTCSSRCAESMAKSFERRTFAKFAG